MQLIVQNVFYSEKTIVTKVYASTYLSLKERGKAVQEPERILSVCLFSPCHHPHPPKEADTPKTDTLVSFLHPDEEYGSLRMPGQGVEF